MRKKKERARRIELENAIRRHRDHDFPDGDYSIAERVVQIKAVNEELWALVDDDA